MSTTLATSAVSIVLVHGGFVDGSGWQGVYDILKSDGYNVSIVQNPTTSLADDVAATKRILSTLSGPAILVGHWDQRPAAGNAQHIGRAFLTAIDRAQASGRTICGLRVPSVISKSDHNVLLDPRQRSRFRVAHRHKIPFGRLLATLT
jgi:hypothetical protein